MNKDCYNLFFVKNHFKVFVASFSGVTNLSKSEANALRSTFSNQLMRDKTHLELDLRRIKMMDRFFIDTLNLLSRLARRYNSTISLVNVSIELYELIELVKRYSVFDVQSVSLEIN